MSGMITRPIISSSFLCEGGPLLQRKIKKTATMRVSPPDSEGNATVTVHAEEQKSYDVNFVLEHRTAMRILFEFLYENQILEAKERLYKH